MGVQQGCVSDEPQINPINFLLTRVCSWCERLFSFHTSVSITVELRFQLLLNLEARIKT